MSKAEARGLLADFCDDIAADHGLGLGGAQYECLPGMPAHITCIDAMVSMNRTGSVLSRTTPIGEYNSKGYMNVFRVPDFVAYDDDNYMERISLFPQARMDTTPPTWDINNSDPCVEESDDSSARSYFDVPVFTPFEELEPMYPEDIQAEYEASSSTGAGKTSLDAVPPDLDKLGYASCTWGLFYKIVSTEITRCFARPGAKVVVFGFDVSEYVDKVKKITHNKRHTARANAGATKAAGDLEAGNVDIRGIPFTYADIKKDALVPYPWSKVLSIRAQRMGIIRFLCKSLLEKYRPAEGKRLILHGHRLDESDHTWSMWEDVPYEYHHNIKTGANDIPIEISSDGARMAYWLENRVGEFDHTAFFFTRSITNNPALRAHYNVNNPAGPIRVHIRTCDTDTIVAFLVYVERMRMIHDSPLLHLLMEKTPTSGNRSDMCIDISRMVDLFRVHFPESIKHPAAYIAYGLYLKRNDYDLDFMSGVGIKVFMNALRYNAHLIGDLVVASPERKSLVVDPEAVRKFVAVCIHENRFYKTKAANEKRREREVLGLLQKSDPIICTTAHMLTLQSAKGRKTPVVTTDVIEKKALRHDYFVALNECHMFGFEREIPFSQIMDYGYDTGVYVENFARVNK